MAEEVSDYKILNALLAMYYSYKIEKENAILAEKEYWVRREVKETTTGWWIDENTEGFEQEMQNFDETVWNIPLFIDLENVLQPGESQTMPISHLIGLMEEASQIVGEDIFTVMQNVFFQNVGWFDNRTGAYAPLNISMLKAIEENYQDNSQAEILNRTITLSNESNFAIRYPRNTPKAQENRRNRRAGLRGSGLLFPEISSLISFIPHPEKFCPEEIYNWFRQQAMTDPNFPFLAPTYVEQMISAFWKTIDVITPKPIVHPEGVMNNEEYWKKYLENAVEKFGPNFIPKYSYKEKGKTQKVRVREVPPIFSSNGVYFFNNKSLPKLFSPFNVFYWNPIRKEPVNNPTNRQQLTNAKYDPYKLQFLLITFYTENDSTTQHPNQVNIIFRPFFVDEYRKWKTNLSHLAAVRFVGDKTDYESIILQMFNNKDIYHHSHIIPDEIKQVECPKMKISETMKNGKCLPHHILLPSMKRTKNGISTKWILNWIYDIETTQTRQEQEWLEKEKNEIISRTQKDLETRQKQKFRAAANKFMTNPYAIAGWEFFVKYNSERKNINHSGLTSAQAQKLWDKENYLEESIWNYQEAKKWYDEQWVPYLGDENIGSFPPSYIQEYDNFNSKFTCITHWLRKLFIQVTDRIHNVYQAHGTIVPRYVEINLIAYNGNRFDHSMVISDCFWGYNFKFLPHKNMKINGWSETKIISNWSNIKIGAYETILTINDKTKVTIAFRLFDPLLFFGIKDSLDNTAKNCGVNQKYRKKEMDHSKLNLTNVQEPLLKTSIQDYLKYDVYLLGHALLYVYDMMYSTIQNLSNDFYSPSEHVLQRKFMVRSTFKNLKRSKVLDELPRCPYWNEAYGLPSGINMMNLYMKSPMLFSTLASTAQKFLKWDKTFTPQMAITSGVREYINQAKVGGRVQAIRRSYLNKEYEKLTPYFQDILTRPMDDLDYMMFRIKLKNVTSCVKDDILYKYKERNGKVIKHNFTTESSSHCKDRHCIKCFYYNNSWKEIEPCKSFEKTSWECPENSYKYVFNLWEEKDKNITKEFTDLLPKHINFEQRTKSSHLDLFIENKHVLLFASDCPLISFDANSLYPSAFILYPINMGKLIPWHMLENSPEKVEDFGELFGIVTFEELIPPAAKNVMPMISTVIPDPMLNSLISKRPKLIEDGEEYVSAFSRLWLEMPLKNFVTDTITAEEMQKNGWTLGKIKEGIVFTEPSYAVGKTQLKLYNKRNKVKKLVKQGKAQKQEEVSIKNIMNSTYGQTIMKDHGATHYISPIKAKRGKGHRDAYVEDLEYLNIGIKSWKEVPESDMSVNTEGVAHQNGIQMLANSKKILNQMVNIVGQHRPCFYYTDTDSLYTSSYWDELFKTEYMKSYGESYEDEKEVPISGSVYPGQMKNDYGTSKMIYNFQTLGPKMKVMEIIGNNGELEIEITFKGAPYKTAEERILSEHYWNGDSYYDMENKLFLKYGIPKNTNGPINISKMSDKKYKSIKNIEKKSLIFNHSSPHATLKLRKAMLGEMEKLRNNKIASFGPKLSFTKGLGIKDIAWLDRTFTTQKVSKKHYTIWKDKEGCQWKDVLMSVEFDHVEDKYKVADFSNTWAIGNLPKICKWDDEIIEDIITDNNMECENESDSDEDL